MQEVVSGSKMKVRIHMGVGKQVSSRSIPWIAREGGYGE